MRGLPGEAHRGGRRDDHAETRKPHGVEEQTAFSGSGERKCADLDSFQDRRISK